jgi:hypothetical protein
MQFHPGASKKLPHNLFKHLGIRRPPTRPPLPNAQATTTSPPPPPRDGVSQTATKQASEQASEQAAQAAHRWQRQAGWRGSGTGCQSTSAAGEEVGGAGSDTCVGGVGVEGGKGPKKPPPRHNIPPPRRKGKNSPWLFPQQEQQHPFPGGCAPFRLHATQRRYHPSKSSTSSSRLLRAPTHRVGQRGQHQHHVVKLSGHLHRLPARAVPQQQQLLAGGAQAVQHGGVPARGAGGGGGFWVLGSGGTHMSEAAPVGAECSRAGRRRRVDCTGVGAGSSVQPAGKKAVGTGKPQPPHRSASNAAV